MIQKHPYLQLCSLLSNVTTQIQTGLTAVLHPDVGNTDNSTKHLPHVLRVSQAINGIAFLPKRVEAEGRSATPNKTYVPKTDSDD